MNTYFCLLPSKSQDLPLASRPVVAPAFAALEDTLIRFFGLVFAAAALFLTPAAQALDYPSRPVRWIVAFPPGGANDIIARVIGQALSQRLGQPFIVENKPGAGGNIGTQLALAAPADGYTLLFAGPHGRRIHRLRQGQSGKDRDGLGGQWHRDPPVRRIVHGDDRRSARARSISRRRPGAQ